MKSIPELSVDSKLLYDRLTQLEPDEFVPYKDLVEMIGRNVQRGARGNLMTAIHKLLYVDQIVIATVMGKGVKRLTDSEIANSIPESTRKHFHRISMRAARKVACAKYENLKRPEQVQHNTALAMFGAITHMTTTRAVKRLEGKIEKAQSVLAIGTTLDAFKE